MKYIDYNNMKAFYTIAEVCHLFEISKDELKQYAHKYNIEPQEDQYGNFGFKVMFVRKLHNYIYKEQKSNESDNNSGIWDESKKRRDPWE